MGAVTTASAECTRQGLLASANSYVAAITAGKLDGLKLSDSNFTYQENNKKADIKKGVLTQPLKIDLTRLTADTLLKKVGDSYLDMWADAKAPDSIPWGTDYERVEGSQLTRLCGGSLPRGGSVKNNGNRRYVIDEVIGSVDILCSFDSLGSLLDSHEVRLEGGEGQVCAYRDSLRGTLCKYVG
ncbi:hypothetical protein B0T25DRAFT_590196 [Lasiosphaeria hispida]|uniref:DUF8021 domain-containing protein n=1 Tax=Lasiosphaeria hispida TaxID=260671 RepID=A0AAJ0MDL0_9PEZI|nr:hypothetical protein B0T25DRAFT_590196 [Lasiosphaeria hispida]